MRKQQQRAQMFKARKSGGSLGRLALGSLALVLIAVVLEHITLFNLLTCRSFGTQALCSQVSGLGVKG